MGKTSSRTANRLDHALRQVDENLEDARAQVAVTRLTQKHARHTADLLAAAIAIAIRSGASCAVVTECLLNAVADVADEAAHRQVVGSLFR